MRNQATTQDAGKLEFAISYLEEEYETLLALAIVLMNRLEPRDPANPSDSDDVTSWRISQIPHERITDTGFIESMRSLVLDA
jgi:hypothetical protein